MTSHSPELQNILDTTDISDIRSIQFFPLSGESFEIKTENIKKLTVYITMKLGKMNFEPNELGNAFTFITSNLESNLSQTEYEDIKRKIEEFVKSGGEVRIEKI